MNSSNEDAEREGHGAGPMVIAIALICLPIFYVLSVGPAVLLYDKLPESGQRAVQIIYLPLHKLDRRLPGRPISKYASLWR